MHCTLEVCVDSTASALAAKRGGADRLELCADLIIGGTTPSPALLRQVKAETGLPVRALIRPRFGDFCYDRYELAQMAECAAELVAAGADGIVTGVSVVDSSETAGIGTKVTGNEPLSSGVGVLDQFIGKSAADGTLTVGSNVVAITGATVSTKGVTTGVNAALAVDAVMG